MPNRRCFTGVESRAFTARGALYKRLPRRAANCGVARLLIWAGGGGGVGLEEFAKRLAVGKRSVFYKLPLPSPPALSRAALSDKARTLSTLSRASKISYMLKLLH